MFAILSLSLVAGLRAETVGTDVAVYIMPCIERVKYFPEFFSYLNDVAMEPAFTVILFITGKYFSTPFFVLFVSQLLVIGPLYCTFYKFRETCPMTIAMVVYVLLLYNMSLCIMRQCIAMALFLFAVFCCDKKKFLKWIITILAIFFHYSTALIVVIYYFVKLFQNRKNTAISNVVLIFLIVLVAVASTYLVDLAHNMGLISDRYYFQFIDRQGSADENVSIFEFGVRGVLVFAPCAVAIIYSNDRQYKSLCYYSVVGYAISFAAIISQYLIRISYPFYFFLLYTIPYTYAYFKKDNLSKLIYTIAVVGVCFIYWYVVYVVWNYFETMPYLLY